MNDTVIAWCDRSWNPTFGCSRVSGGCSNCYAETIALKFGHSRLPWTAANAKANVVLKPHKLREPYALKKPSRVFVNSMSDLFHPEIPNDYIARVFAVMNDLPQHTFQVLTKRPERAATWPGPWTANIWMGTSIEDARALHRISDLLRCPAAVRFISAEPLLGPLGNVDLTGIHWVIAGGESGQHMRAHPERWMDHAWAREIRDQCQAAGVAYFFKQSSGIRTEMGTALEEADGSRTAIRQYPGEMTPPRCERGEGQPVTAQGELLLLG